MLGTVTRLTVPADSATVSAVIELLDESTQEKSKAIISATALKSMASLDKVPQVGDVFQFNVWKVVK